MELILIPNFSLLHWHSHDMDSLERSFQKKVIAANIKIKTQIKSGGNWLIFCINIERSCLAVENWTRMPQVMYH